MVDSKENYNFDMGIKGLSLCVVVLFSSLSETSLI